MLITPDLLGSGKDLFFEDDRNELALGVVLLFVSRHPLSPAHGSDPGPSSAEWRYYKAFRTFSADSTLPLTC
jgi:hypothetical protein